MPGEIISERRARSNRNAGRHHRGFASDFLRNPHAACHFYFAELQHANFMGAELHQAHLAMAQLRGANDTDHLRRRRIFPDLGIDSSNNPSAGRGTADTAQLSACPLAEPLWRLPID